MVDPERVHVDRHVRGELGGVDADLRAVAVRQLGELADGRISPVTFEAPEIAKRS